jgi:ankyrin repeat protein
VKAVLEGAPELVSITDAGGRTALHTACADDGGADPSVVDVLLRTNPASAKMRDINNESPLQLALLSGTPLSAVKQLVDAAGPAGEVI